MQTKHKYINKMTTESTVLLERSQLPDEPPNLSEWLKQEIAESNLSRKEQEEIGDNLSKNNPDINEIIELGKHLKNYKHDYTTSTTNSVKLQIVPTSKCAATLNRMPIRPRAMKK